jgi:hypothetical protein
MGWAGRVDGAADDELPRLTDLYAPFWLRRAELRESGAH